jgi:hypothetical protein
VIESLPEILKVVTPTKRIKFVPVQTWVKVKLELDPVVSAPVPVASKATDIF